MRKIVISLAVAPLMFAGSLAAQAPKAYKMTLAESVNAPAYAQPRTTVKVRVHIEQEIIKTGPYARYAQKYMGAMAPLSDKEIYTIKRAEILYADPDTAAGFIGKQADDKQGKTKAVSHVRNHTDFSKSSPDRMSVADRSVEDMARDATNTIFTLRKRRFDLITGEAGEHVYGEGLKAAIEEMARMENEYLSLFFGKQAVTTLVKEYDVVPEEGKTVYVAFRFSPDRGAMPESDVSGNPVVLNIKPDGKSGMVAGKPDKRAAEIYRVADWATCTLSDGANELASARVPIYQFGTTVSVGSSK